MNDVEVAKERFQVLDHAPVGMCVIRSDYVVLFWNTCLQSRTKIEKEEIVGQSLHSFFPHFRQPSYGVRIDTIFQGGPPAIFSSQLHGNIFPSPLRDGGVRTQHTTASMIPSGKEGEHWVLLAVEDVTELTRRTDEYRKVRDQALAQTEELRIREKEWQRANEDLESANQKIRDQQEMMLEEERNKVLLELAGATAHELNQPLMALLGNIELIEINKNNPEKLTNNISQVVAAGERIATITKQIQNIRHYEVRKYLGSTKILNIDQDVVS